MAAQVQAQQAANRKRETALGGNFSAQQRLAKLHLRFALRHRSCNKPDPAKLRRLIAGMTVKQAVKSVMQRCGKRREVFWQAE